MCGLASLWHPALIVIAMSSAAGWGWAAWWARLSIA